MTREQVTSVLLEQARKCRDLGPGYAQQSIVIRNAAKQLNIGRDELTEQQFLLTCWYDLFRTGELSLGYDLENPGAPWFHFSDPIGGV